MERVERLESWDPIRKLFHEYIIIDMHQGNGDRGKRHSEEENDTQGSEPDRDSEGETGA